MQKEAKVTNIQGDGMFNDLYKFEIELDNGDSGKVYKKRDDSGVQIGETITYTKNDKGTIKVQTGYEKRFPEKFKDISEYYESGEQDINNIISEKRDLIEFCIDNLIIEQGESNKKKVFIAFKEFSNYLSPLEKDFQT